MSTETASGSAEASKVVVPAAETIPILDFGSQYTQLIARRIRELGAFSLLVAPDTDLETETTWIIANNYQSWVEEKPVRPNLPISPHISWVDEKPVPTRDAETPFAPPH